MTKFSKVTTSYLEKAGWSNDRNFQNTLEYLNALNSEGYRVFGSVENFFKNFGGLVIKHPHGKAKEKEDYFHFNVIKAIENYDSSWILDEYSLQSGKELCIIGEAFRGNLVLCMSQDQNIYAGIDEDLYLVGVSIEEAIENLCQGKDLKKIEPALNDESAKLFFFYQTFNKLSYQKLLSEKKNYKLKYYYNFREDFESSSLLENNFPQEKLEEINYYPRAKAIRY
jgi:hypothetical protein